MDWNQLRVGQNLNDRNSAMRMQPAAESTHGERVRQEVTQLDIEIAMVQRNIVSPLDKSI